MNKSDAQKLTELLGGCWHEVVARGLENICSCGFKSYLIVSLDEHIEESNPTYKNPKDILNKMKEFCGEERYIKFIRKISLKKHIDYAAYDEEPDKVSFVPMSTYEFINAYILNIPALVTKAIEFLDGEK